MYCNPEINYPHNIDVDMCHLNFAKSKLSPMYFNNYAMK